MVARWLAAGALMGALTLLSVAAIMGPSPWEGPLVLTIGGNRGVHQGDVLVLLVWAAGALACVVLALDGDRVVAFEWGHRPSDEQRESGLRGRRRRAVILALPYALAMAFVAFWPRHVDRRLDSANLWPAMIVRRLFDISHATMYEIIETTANVIWFMPLGAIVVLWTLRRSILAAVGVGFTASALIELGQLLILAGQRTASAGDVIANTSGAMLGAVAVVLWESVRTRRVERREPSPHTRIEADRAA